jgi:hypothetical protein
MVISFNKFREIIEKSRLLKDDEEDTMVNEMNKDFMGKRDPSEGLPKEPEPPEDLEPTEGLESSEEPVNIADLDVLRKNLRGSSNQAISPEPRVSETEVAEPEDLELGAGTTKEADVTKDTAPWLKDEPPDKKGDLIKWKLMHGISELECVQSGDNPNSVRICAQELEKAGYRKRPSKTDVGKAVALRATDGNIRLFASGAPPEALVNAMALGLDGDGARLYERGMKDGAKLVIMGVRIAQELSAVAVQQAKPVIEMSKAMREGEAQAAKSAASEAAVEAAERVAGEFGPVLANLSRPAEGGDPIKAMLARVMEPMMNNMLKMFMPGMAGNQPAPGWKVEQQ